MPAAKLEVRKPANTSPKRVYTYRQLPHRKQPSEKRPLGVAVRGDHVSEAAGLRMSMPQVCRIRLGTGVK